MSFSDEYANQIASIAIESIASGLEFSVPQKVDLSEVPEALRQKIACFVTIYKDDECCGCMGTITPDECLAVDISNSTFNAAFADPRYAPLSAESILDGDVEIEISVLSKLEPVVCNSQKDLSLKIGKDNGLVIVDGDRDAVFLPQMWNMYHDSDSFINGLKSELGYVDDYWSATLKFYTFTTDDILCEIPLDEYYNSLNEEE